MMGEPQYLLSGSLRPPHTHITIARCLIHLLCAKDGKCGYALSHSLVISPVNVAE